MDRPCCNPFRDCDVTDEPAYDSPLHEKGCCTPIPVRRDCLAPVLPTTECDEADPVMEYDPELDIYRVLTTMYDSTCSALLDSTGSPLLSLIS